MRACFVHVSMLIVALAAVGRAQSRPDFSGVWTPDESLSTPSIIPTPPPATPGGPPPPPPPPQTRALSISQSSTEMKVDRRVEVAGREETYTFLYKLDGSESVNRMGVIVFRTTASWDGESLVLSSIVSAEGNAVGTLKDVYRLENGNLIVENIRNAPVGTFSSRTVHKRVQNGL